MLLLERQNYQIFIYWILLLGGWRRVNIRGGASPEKVGWKRDRIDGQKVYLTIFMSFLLKNEYRLEESGVDMSTPVHPLAPPLVNISTQFFCFPSEHTATLLFSSRTGLQIYNIVLKSLQGHTEHLVCFGNL